MHKKVFNIISLSITACLYSAETPPSAHHVTKYNVSQAIPIKQHNSSVLARTSPTSPQHIAIQAERAKRKKMLEKLYQNAGSSSATTRSRRTIQRTQSQHILYAPSSATSPQAHKIQQQAHSAPNSLGLKRNYHGKKMIPERSKSSFSQSPENLHQVQDKSTHIQQQAPPRTSLRRSHSMDDIRNKVPNLAARFLEYFKLVTPKALEYQATRNPQGFVIETEHDTYIFKMHVIIEKNSNKEN